MKGAIVKNLGGLWFVQIAGGMVSYQTKEEAEKVAKEYNSKSNNL